MPDPCLGWGLPRVSYSALSTRHQGRLRWKRGTPVLSSTSSSPPTPPPPRTGETDPSELPPLPYCRPKFCLPDLREVGQGVLFLGASSGRRRSSKGVCDLCCLVCLLPSHLPWTDSGHGVVDQTLLIPRLRALSPLVSQQMMTMMWRWKPWREMQSSIWSPRCGWSHSMGA